MLKISYCLSVLVAIGGFQGVSNTKEEQFKEKMVDIQINGVLKCLGAIVEGNSGKYGTETNPVIQRIEIENKNEILKSDAQFIATAAHCVYGVPISSLKVKLGKTESEVKRVMVHPYYLPPSPDYDIALLKTKISEGQSGLVLSKDVPSPGANLTAVNWNLKENIATLEDRKSCRAKLASHTVVSTRMLCANTGTGSVADGSPLINDKVIIGVGSYYVSGGSEQKPKIFTNIANSEIYSFIERYVD